MADMRLAILEERLGILEAELRTAKAQLRTLATWRQGMAGVRVLTVGWLAVLVLVFGLVVQTPKAAPATFTAPFTVTSPSTKARMVVRENDKKTGLDMDFYNAGGGLVTVLGVGETTGTGGAVFQSPDGSHSVVLGLHPDGLPFMELDAGGKKAAEIGPGTTAGMGLRIWDPPGKYKVSPWRSSRTTDICCSPMPGAQGELRLEPM